MKVRTLVSILLALASMVLVAFLAQRNQDLLDLRFAVGESATLPLYAVLLVVFFLGFVPPVVALVAQHFQHELTARRERRLSREAESRQGSFRRAVDFQADGQWSRAAEELEAVLSDKPEDFGALLRYGEVLRHQGRSSEALEVHRRASVLYPQSVALLYEMAEDYAELGDEEVSHEIRNRILRDFSDVGLEVQRRRRNQAMAEGNWREATRLHDAIEARLRENGDPDELERERSIRLGLAYQRGLSRMADDRLDEAREIFSALLDEEPLFIPAAIMLGEAALLGGSSESAVGQWRRGYEETGSPVFLQRIEDHFIERAQPAEAISTLHSLITDAENDLLPRFYLGRLHYRLEMLDEALRELSAISDRVRSSPTYHLLLARIHERRGELGHAVSEYVESLQQLGLTSAEYACSACGERSAEWLDRCGSCGAWNSVDLDFEEERISASELGVRERPVWSVVENGDESGPDTD